MIFLLCLPFQATENNPGRNLILKNGSKKIIKFARCWQLTLIILATQEAEIRRITVQSQSEQRVHEALS
jgi:hypothetical protein